jgi:small nuclear ribonucleoprotein (snRNP)-like protein
MKPTKQAMHIHKTLLITMMLIAILFSPVKADAKAKILPIEGVSYNVELSMNDNLKNLVGQKVNVTLNSGKTFYGKLTKVGTHLIHLEKLDRKEFFDALIRIENISAVDLMFRSYKR